MADHNAPQTCPTCGKELPNMARLIEHAAKHHPTRPR